MSPDQRKEAAIWILVVLVLGLLICSIVGLSWMGQAGAALAGGLPLGPITGAGFAGGLPVGAMLDLPVGDLVNAQQAAAAADVSGLVADVQDGNPSQSTNLKYAQFTADTQVVGNNGQVQLKYAPPVGAPTQVAYTGAASYPPGARAVAATAADGAANDAAAAADDMVDPDFGIVRTSAKRSTGGRRQSKRSSK